MMTTPLMLLSARYDGLENKIVLKFYDIENHKIVDWIDNTNHMPYCYSKTADLDELLLRDDVLEVKKEKKFDIILEKEIDIEVESFGALPDSSKAGDTLSPSGLTLRAREGQ